MYFEASLHGLKQLGGGGRTPPPYLQTQCSRDGFQKEPYTSKQPRTAQKSGVGGGGWLGGAQPPPICKHNARMMGFENTN